VAGVILKGNKESVMKEELVGLWRLVSFEAAGPGGIIVHPFGTDAVGYITYEANGFVSMHLSAKDRPLSSAANMLQASPKEKESMAESCLSYCGSYEIIDDKVHHHVEVCTFPNYVGKILTRDYRVKDNMLQLSSRPETSGGAEGIKAVWERVGHLRE
jgi:hypothetical protein